MIELRPYQEECVSRAVKAYENNPQGYEIIVIPTGGGKTLCFAQFAHELQKKHGINVLVIAHRDELLGQAADKYRMIDPTAIIGKVGSGIHEYGGEVTVASVQTISRPDHLKQLKAIGYGLIIVDECHHIASPSYVKVLETLSDAFVLGVTATPERLDKKDILRGREPLFQIDIISLVEQGYLCNFRSIAIQTDTNLDSIRSQMGDFNEHELDLAVNTNKRNELIVQKYQEYSPGKRAICFCVTVGHAESMAETFQNQGVSSAVIKGSTSSEERKKIYHDFRTGKIKVLCSIMVLTEGFDEPFVEVVILARPTQSRGLFIQMFGRGLRLAPGKKECLLLDITDNCLNHRLIPQNLRKAIRKENIKDGESILETLAKESAASEEKEVQVRKLKDKRLSDMHVDLMEKLEWKELPNGAYILDVRYRRDVHSISLQPSISNPEKYVVLARLAHHRKSTQKTQAWSGELPLDYAQQIAESGARKILDGKISWVDRFDPGRNESPTENQLATLQKFHIPIQEGLTKGQASDLIGQRIAQFERQKSAKKAVEA